MNGGTAMYCPQCQDITTCKAIPVPKITGDTADYSQRCVHAAHGDLNWFQRGRECLTCGHTFITSEVNTDFVFELVELRDALAEIKLHAEEYVRESKKASTSLSRLSDSLKVLRALRIYKSA